MPAAAAAHRCPPTDFYLSVEGEQRTQSPSASMLHYAWVDGDPLPLPPAYPGDRVPGKGQQETGPRARQDDSGG